MKTKGYRVFVKDENGCRLYETKDGTYSYLSSDAYFYTVKPIKADHEYIVRVVGK